MIEVFEQYKDIQKEIKDLRERIEKRSKENIISTDTVNGSSPSFPYIATKFTIVGEDEVLYKRKRGALERLNKMRMERECDLLDTEVKIEGFIGQIKDSRTRQVFRLRFIDGLNQDEVASKLHIHRTLVSKIITNTIKSESFTQFTKEVC